MIYGYPCICINTAYHDISPFCVQKALQSRKPSSRSGASALSNFQQFASDLPIKNGDIE